MDRNEFRKRMLDLKSYRQSNPDKGYWDWKVLAFAGGGENEELYNITDTLKGYYSNHTGTPTMYVPLTKDYEATPEDFGEIVNVHTPEVTITPKDNISLEAAVDKGRKEGFKIAAPIIGGAALSSMSAVGGLGKAIDLAGIINDPVDPFNYNGINSFKSVSKYYKKIKKNALDYHLSRLANIKDNGVGTGLLTANHRTGKNLTEDEIRKIALFKNSLNPLLVKDYYSAFREDGKSRAASAVLAPVAYVYKNIRSPYFALLGNIYKSPFANLTSLGRKYYKQYGTKITDTDPSITLSHELEHIVNKPTKEAAKTALEWFDQPLFTDYFKRNNSTELAARGSLIKDWLKIAKDRDITTDELKLAAEQYVSDTGIDNNMSEIFDRIIDWDKAAKWFSLYSTGLVTPLLLSSLIDEYSEGGEITDYDKQLQITNAITYALSRGNVDAAKSLMSRGTPDTNYSYPQSGAIDPVFSLYDTPVLGDAMITTDAARYAMNGDWTNAGLAMAGLIIPGVVGKGIKKVNRHIPSVKGYKESVENLINRIMDPQDLQKLSDWNNMLYRSAELVYEPDVIDRAAATGTTDRLNRVRSMYENDLENMPKIRMTDELNGARGRVLLTKEAEQRYRLGIKPSDSDFEILVDRNIDPTQEVIDHELRHWNQYMEQGSPNINVMPTSSRSGVRPTSKNKLDPNHSDYYGKQGESEAYILNAYRDMKQKGYLINFKNFKKYYNSLKDIDTKKRAISQFSSLEDAYKWMLSMPLIGTAGVIAMNNKEQSN